MKKKSLSVKNRNPNLVLKFLKDKSIHNIYKKFEKILDSKKNYIVGVSGGPDSLALAFFSKCYSLLNKNNFYYFIVDHKLRKNSSREAKIASNLLKKIDIKSEILVWKGNKPNSNVQSIARKNRYDLLIKQCFKFNSRSILLAHQTDDLNENFFLRLIRGSGLKGLVSLQESVENKRISFIRPLLSFKKKDLEKVSISVFKSFIRDPSNLDENFKRIMLRNLINKLEKEGFNKKKFNLTLKNLKDANNALNHYTKKNIIENTVFNRRKNYLIINKIFFEQPNEIIIRSLTNLMQKISDNYYPPRGKKINYLISRFNSKSELKKVTLGGCIFEKINETLFIYKE